MRTKVKENNIQLLILPGLGADHRIAGPLASLPFTLITPDYIDATAKETLAQYSARFAQHLIDQQKIDPATPLYIAGISFGGAVAQEMSRILPVQGIILLGSLISGEELAPFIEQFGKRGAILLPLRVYEIATAFVPFVMNFASNIPKDAMQLSKVMYRDLSKNFFRAAYRMLSQWRGVKTSVPILRLHGRQDHIIPLRGLRQQPDVVLNDAKHLIIFSETERILDEIKRFIASNNPQ